MTIYSQIASADIRSFVWQKIQDAGLLDIQNYYADGFDDPLVPIIPSQQIPEFNNLLPGKSYMIYDWEVKAVPVQWWLTEETMSISVISQNYEKINELTSFMHDLFRRYDDSATDINAYFGGNSQFIYHHIAVDSVMSPEPFSSEGDYQIGTISISYGYARKISSNGRF
jgi:hypothetical protein